MGFIIHLVFFVRLIKVAIDLCFILLQFQDFIFIEWKGFFDLLRFNEHELIWNQL